LHPAAVTGMLAEQEVSMIRLYHAPLTRSVRIVWLLEELGIPYELKKSEFVPPTTPFSQDTPLGKFPVIQDGALTMFESGAILEYILETYGKGRLAPAPGSPLRGPFLQWVHFAEATLMPPVGQLAWSLMFTPESERIPAVIEHARKLASAAIEVLEKQLAGKNYLVGDEFSGADVMMGYSLQAAKWFGLLTERHPNVSAYLERLASRAALQKALEV
jgi:glutathione S-transferase